MSTSWTNLRKKRGFFDHPHARLRVLHYHHNVSFRRQCKIANTHINNTQTLLTSATLYSNAPGYSDDPQKRAIPALLWSAVLLAIGSTKFNLARYIMQNVVKGTFIFNITSSLLSFISLGSYLINSRRGDKWSALHTWDSFDMESRMTLLYQKDTSAMFVYLDKFENGLNQLFRHTFPSNFISHLDILKELPELRQSLEDKNIRLLIDNPADIASLPSSFIVQGDMIHMFIHVPISQAPQLTAYKYIPTPTVYTMENTTKLAQSHIPDTFLQ